MHRSDQKNTDVDSLPESLIYLNRHMKFHFLVDWLALMSLYDASKRGINKMLLRCPRKNLGESATLGACVHGCPAYLCHHFSSRGYLEKETSNHE